MPKHKLPPLTLAGRLKALRAERGLTQQQLADAAGLSQQTVGHLESGRRHRPTGDTLVRLAEALGIPPALLLRG
jgi:transcriptional regulator with XRE-family HTH domain